MSLVGFAAKNHPQQQLWTGPRPDIDDRAMDPVVFAGLNERFHFTVDAASSHENALLDRHWTLAEDGLKQSWRGERVWCNPPYSNIEPWVEKAWREIVWAELAVMLLPANRTEQGWWQRQIEPFRDGRVEPTCRVEFLSGRIRFLRPGQRRIGPNERPPFGCCLIIWQGMA